MRISDWSSEVCSSDLGAAAVAGEVAGGKSTWAGAVDLLRQLKPDLGLEGAIGLLSRIANRRGHPGRRSHRQQVNAAIAVHVGADHRRGDVVCVPSHGRRKLELAARLPDQAMLGKRVVPVCRMRGERSEEHTSELQSLMRNSYAVFCLKKKTHTTILMTATI